MLLASDESLDRNKSLASGKYVTAAGVGFNTSRPPCKVAGESVSVIKGVRLKVGSVNVGSMQGKSEEIAEMACRRKLDICCLQETYWKGGGAKTIGYDDCWYKFFWVGCEEGVSGVGILVAEKWINHVVEVRRVNERVMVLRLAIGRSVFNIVSVYAPQTGRIREEKEEFYIVLGNVLKNIGENERLIV